MTTTASQILNRVSTRLFPGAGCSDGGCVFGHPGGMHTNGGCRCLSDGDKTQVRIQARRLAHVARTLAALVAEEKVDLLKAAK